MISTQLVLACHKDEPKEIIEESPIIENILISGSNCTSFNRLIRGQKMEELYSVKQTLDSGYIFCGGTETIAENESDILLLKSNCFGETEWIKTISNGDYDMGTDVIQTSTGEFIISSMQGYYHSCHGQLIKLANNGDQIWKKTYDFGSLTFFQKVLETSDGGFIICGYDDSNGGFIFKTDSAGTEIWRNELRYNTKVFDITLNSNNNFFACGTISRNQQDDLYILELNQQGEFLWSRSIDKDNRHNTAYSIISMNNNDFCISGYNRYSGTELYGFVMRFRENGYPSWYKSYNIEKMGPIGNIVKTQNEEILAQGAQDNSLTIHKINAADGSILWTNNKNMSPLIRDMQITKDQGLILSGNQFVAAGNRNGFILKTDSDGN